MFDVLCCHMGRATKHPMPDQVKQSFVIFDIRALWRTALSISVPGCQKLQMMAQRVLATGGFMTTVGVNWLIWSDKHASYKNGRNKKHRINNNIQKYCATGHSLVIGTLQVPHYYYFLNTLGSQDPKGLKTKDKNQQSD